MSSRSGAANTSACSKELVNTRSDFFNRREHPVSHLVAKFWPARIILVEGRSVLGEYGGHHMTLGCQGLIDG